MDTLTLTELQQLCQARALATSGNKTELIQRLAGAPKAKPAAAGADGAAKPKPIKPATPPPPMSAIAIALFPSDYDALAIPQLKHLCRERVLPITGIKGDLVSRLKAADPRNMTLAQLKDACRNAGAAMTGTKPMLIDRVMRMYVHHSTRELQSKSLDELKELSRERGVAASDSKEELVQRLCIHGLTSPIPTATSPSGDAKSTAGKSPVAKPAAVKAVTVKAPTDNAAAAKPTTVKPTAAKTTASKAAATKPTTVKAAKTPKATVAKPATAKSTASKATAAKAAASKTKPETAKATTAKAAKAAAAKSTAAKASGAQPAASANPATTKSKAVKPSTAASTTKSAAGAKPMTVTKIATLWKDRELKAECAQDKEKGARPVAALPVNELKELCRRFGLLVGGKHDDLVERLTTKAQPASKTKAQSAPAPANPPAKSTQEEPKSTLTKAQLKEQCRQRGVPMTGSKDELAARLEKLDSMVQQKFRKRKSPASAPEQETTTKRTRAKKQAT